jgi:hypothetical protein
MTLRSWCGENRSVIGTVGVETPNMLCNPSFHGQGVVVIVVVVVVLRAAPLPISSFVVHDDDVDVDCAP